MGPINLALWLGGIVLIWLGWSRFRRPWSRYQELKASESNVARYEAWRGGVRDQSVSGASTMMEFMRRQAMREAVILVVGIVLVVAGFAVR
jgi:threonine/homoserine/homoserine lactone efflux protein